jgi:hypothetical protein
MIKSVNKYTVTHVINISVGALYLNISLCKLFYFILSKMKGLVTDYVVSCLVGVNELRIRTAVLLFKILSFQYTFFPLNYCNWFVVALILVDSLWKFINFVSELQVLN